MVSHRLAWVPPVTFLQPRRACIDSLRAVTRAFGSASEVPLAHRLDGLERPTVWHEFSPMAIEYDAVNLGQGFPNWDPPHFVLDAMNRAIDARAHAGEATFTTANQYARSQAHGPLAQALAEDYSTKWNRPIDPLTEVATATGSTNILYCALHGLVNPGDEVLILEPAFDIYAPQVQMAGGTTVSCPLRPDPTVVVDEHTTASNVFKLDIDELRSKVTDKTKALILNTPHNPTGKIFSEEELRGIAQVVLDHPNMVVLADEVYENLVFDPVKEPHISIATLDNGVLWDRTLTMSSAGKTFSCTGWKVGWAVGPSSLVKAVTAVQQWVNFSAATPTQDAIAHSLPIARHEPYQGYSNYYEFFRADYTEKRDILMNALSSVGIQAVAPAGSFFIMADTSTIDFPYEHIASTQHSSAMPTSPMPRDWALSRWFTQEVGVTAIPPSAFYAPENAHLAKNYLRFAFCKDKATLLQGKERLEAHLKP